MYYGRRRRYKEKKHKPSDLELLEYDRDKLISVITKTTKKLTCSRCSKVTDLSSLGLHAFHSGQYGIYYQCFECRKNLSIPVKIDLEDDDGLNNIDKSIDELKKNIKELKKNYQPIQGKKYAHEEKIVENQKAIDTEIEFLYSEKDKMQREISKLAIHKGGAANFFGVLLNDVAGIKTGSESIYAKSFKAPDGYGQSVHVKNENVSRFNKLDEDIEKLAEKIKRVENSNFLARRTYPEGVNENLYIFWESCDFLNPNTPRDLEKIEEKHLKPLIAKKEKRVLLLRKIFRTTNGSVYVLENESMPDFYKIGWTDRSPEERAKELSGTGLPTPYRVAYSKSTNLTGEVEKEIHNKLDKFRHRSNREFFKVELDTIKKAIHDTLEI